MNKPIFFYCLVLTALAFSAMPSPAQPAVTTPYGQAKAHVSAMESEYQNDARRFRARWFPKLGIPLKREDYFGVWNYFNHGTHPVETVYDNDRSKRTYYFEYAPNRFIGHDAVDWLVSYRNFGNNELINPFPSHAVVKVTSASDTFPDTQANNHLGNSIALTCYLDGNPNNGAAVNRLIVTFSHLKFESILVEVGDFVTMGQTLAQVGFSGGTEFEVMHAHTTYVHMNVKLDPFYGWYNPNLDESMFQNQAEIERITNWKQQENERHLTINNKFHVVFPNKQTNLYTFRANVPIAAIRVMDQNGNIVPGVDILQNPNLRNLFFGEESFSEYGHNWTVYTVSFNWYQNADSGMVNRDIPFLIETAEGDLSNRVFVRINDDVPPRR